MTHTATKILTLAVALALLVLAACSNSTAPSSSAASSSQVEPTLPPSSSSFSSSSPSLSSDSASTLSPSSTQEVPSSSSESAVEAIPIEPNANIPVNDIPQPDGPPQLSHKEIIDEMNQDQVYSAGRITLTRATIDGTVSVVVVDNDTAKEIILGYVDSMQASGYNAMNVPPGGGKSVSVSVHRNDIIEHYIFTNQTVNGDTLGKNLQDTDVKKWTIISKDAFPYVSSLFS